MKNKIIVQISDKEYTLITEEQEDYVKTLALEITKMIDEAAYKNLRTSKLDAAMITCLTLYDKMQKLSEDNDNMRREILGYIEDIGKLSKKLTALERQHKSGKGAEVRNAVEKFMQEPADENNAGEADKTEDTAGDSKIV